MKTIQLLDLAITLMAVDQADSKLALYLFVAYLLTRGETDECDED